MSSPTILTVIILLSVVLGIALGLVIASFLQRRGSYHYRQRFGIPDIIGEWRCQWFDDSASSEEPKVEDRLIVQKWTYRSRFIAIGQQPQFNLEYPLEGEIDPSRIVTLTYKAARYPFEPNRGIVCLEIARNGRTMAGHWYGRRFSGKLGGGRVFCTRVVNSEAA